MIFGLTIPRIKLGLESIQQGVTGMSVGENIKRFREDAGYTQKQLAEIIQVKEPYISALERGQRRPGKKILPLLCDALGVDEKTILFGTREEYQRPLSYEEKVLLAATESLSKDQLREVIQYMMKLKASGE
ncbi:XRE family transcriptional regulator [Oryzomonas rubra]|uniref:XRE family transcriptional regulator n=2 Tax=Geobacteraceae TaxID=213422 RepID=A0A5A9XPU9_9BACT|nr:XRE family transcriptional regulator [Oryzomonas rubra]